jgi:hypothetical protein
MGLEAFRQEWIRIASDPVSRAGFESPYGSSIMTTLVPYAGKRLPMENRLA